VSGCANHDVKVTSVAGARVCPTRPRSDRVVLETRGRLHTNVHLPIHPFATGPQDRPRGSHPVQHPTQDLHVFGCANGFLLTAVRQFSTTSFLSADASHLFPPVLRLVFRLYASVSPLVEAA
jgi:hypothetical protein